MDSALAEGLTRLAEVGGPPPLGNVEASDTGTALVDPTASLVRVRLLGGKKMFPNIY